MLDLYDAVPKILTYVKITNDEVDLDLPCGVCVRYGRLGTTVRGSGL